MRNLIGGNAETCIIRQIEAKAVAFVVCHAIGVLSQGYRDFRTTACLRSFPAFFDQSYINPLIALVVS